MMIGRLAFRNILGAGTRTWLNVIALSFAYVTIIFLQGLYEGMNDQLEQATISSFYGGGQYWQEKYDPYDPLSLVDAHAVVPAALRSLVEENAAASILVRQATIYPQGRFRNILLKGIDPAQTILSVPSSLLSRRSDMLPALIGSRMAKSTGVKKGDQITVQWRDVHGAFDARELTIVEIFQTSVQEIDNDQIWIPLNSLRQISEMQEEATMVVLKGNAEPVRDVNGWKFKDLNFLLKDIHTLVSTKRIGGSIMYLVLLFLAMLAIFDTQVLSVWHRKKEMGTLMALGMTRTRIIGLFTLEGALHGVLAALLGAIYGVPLLTYIAREGWELPQATDSFGYALGERMFPTYSAALIVGTALLVLVVTTFVSFLPTRKIASLKPTDALRGKMT
jgi:ABC-type lipoprotein release transport system permease subunit